VNFITKNAKGNIDGPKARPRMVGKVNNFNNLSVEDAISHDWFPCEIVGGTFNPIFERRVGPVFSTVDNVNYVATYTIIDLELHVIQANLKDMVNRAYFCVSQRSWQIPGSSERLQQRPKDIINWNTLYAYVATLPNKESVLIRTENNVNLTMTAADANIMFAAMYSNWSETLQLVWNMKDSIKAATTIEELKVIEATINSTFFGI